MDNLFANITTFIFDVDGVLSDGTFIMLPSGEALRHMNIKDGYAMQFAVKKGYRIAIITGGRSETVKLRFNRLGIDDIFLGITDKVKIFEEYLSQHNVKSENVLYMGDDMPDYEVMQLAGLPCCPADASDEIKAISKYISDKKGGKGCARDVIEKTLKSKNLWFDVGEFGW